MSWRPDALDSLETQNEMVGDLLSRWRAATEQLLDHDDVDARWRRGSYVKLLLEHLAVREEAKRRLIHAVEDRHADLAGRLEGDGRRRRTAISDLDGQVAGRKAMDLNTPDVDRAVAEIDRVVAGELDAEDEELLGRLRDVLGAPGERDLPSGRRVQMTSATRPHPTDRWYDRIGLLRAVRAYYDHLRVSPRGGTAPTVDSAREHTPGPRS